MNDPAIDTAALPQDGLEHRLHPLSWLFVLLAHLWQFIPALVLLLFAGRGDDDVLGARAARLREGAIEDLEALFALVRDRICHSVVPLVSAVVSGGSAAS